MSTHPIAAHSSVEHHHEHIHHSVRNSNDEPTYTASTTIGHPHILPQSPLSMSDEKDPLPAAMDEEKASRSNGSEEDGAGEPPRRKWSFTAFYRKFRWCFHLAILAVFTGWWITGLVLNQKRKKKLNWVIPFLLYLCIVLRLLFFYVPSSIAMRPLRFIWGNTAVKAGNMIPGKLKVPLGALLVIVVFILGAFIPEETPENKRENRAISLFGLLVFIFVLWITSRNRGAVKWHTVIVGMLIQFLVALFVLRWKVGYDIFTFVSSLARSLLGFAGLGTAFLTTPEVAALPWFLIGVLPAIIFFVALVQMLYFWGVLQWFICKFAVFFFWAMKVSGAEAVVAAASPFIGQGESAMLIRPFILHLTQAELHQVMCSGFATIAGSVLVAYIGMGISPQALISSCVMSIPASLAVSKLRFPEEEESLTAGKVVIPEDDEHKSVNSLHAFAEGAWLGLKIAGMITATLLCILALLGLVNGLLTWWGRYFNIHALTIELILGYLCYPVAWLLGVPKGPDVYKVAKLIGVKLIANEFVAYRLLVGEEEYIEMADRSKIIATYALCGFANIGSLGTQIGVLSQLAPPRSGDVSRLAVSALISGAISTLTSASVAGMLVTDQAMFNPPAAT